MKYFVKYALIALIILSCSKDKTGNMIVQGQIDGLKKGTMYLQKIQDTVLISVDSVALNGSPDFVLSDDLDSPEMYYIQLDNNEDKVISFFGEKGTISINSKLDKFSYSVKITGSENQRLLEEHNEMLSKFNGRQLEIIKEQFEAQKENDSVKLSELETEEASLNRRKFYYTVNYAVNNASNEVAPYLALTELRFASSKILDTVNNVLSEQVRKSKYGIELARFIKARKELEENQ